MGAGHSGAGRNAASASGTGTTCKEPAWLGELGVTGDPLKGGGEAVIEEGPIQASSTKVNKDFAVIN